MALLSIEGDECSGCGHPLSETTGSKVDSRGRTVQAHVYDAEPVVCNACVAISHAAEAMAESNPDAGSMRYRVIKRT